MSRKITALWYPARKDRYKEYRSGINREIEPESEPLIKRGSYKEFIGGTIRLYYDPAAIVPTVEINGKIYHGDLVFAAVKDGKHLGLTARQIMAIKLVVNII